MTHTPTTSSTAPRPVDHSFRQSHPGDSAVFRHDIDIVDVETRRVVRVQTPQIPFLNQLQSMMRDSTWTGVKWTPDSERLLFLSGNRGPSRISLHVADAATGATRLLMRDSSRYTMIDHGRSDETP